MASFNKVLLLGNLTRDPEMRYAKNGTAICELGIAVNEAWTDGNGQKKEAVTFVDVTCFGTLAENCAKYLSKGQPAHVDGKLRLETWDDKQSGQKRSKLTVIAEGVQFLNAKP